MTIEKHLIQSREQWLALRRNDVTASVVGALFGTHPYVSALKLFLAHSGVEFPVDDDDPVLRRGRILESAVAAAVAEEHPEWQIEKARHYYRDPARRLGATPDFFIHGDPRGLGVLQCKSIAPHVYERDWDGGKVTPFWIQLQTLTECMLTEAAFGVIGGLRIHAFDLACAIHEVPRHAGAEKRIADAVARFWQDVTAGREPEPDYGRDAELIKIISPREVKGKEISLAGDNELPGLLEQREQIMKGIAGYEARKEEIETEIRFKMRDAERIVGIPDWSITYKTQHRPEYTVRAKNIRTLRIHHSKREAAHV